MERNTSSHNTISRIDFGLLGMPTHILFSNGCITEYLYTADGTKLRTVHITPVPYDTTRKPSLYWPKDNSLHEDTTLYVGALEIEVGTPATAKYYFSKGYLSLSNYALQSCNYTVTDYLGSVRHVDRTMPNGVGNEIVQVNNYYTYGGMHADDGTGVDVQTHKYNGKELDTMHGLNLHDSQARWYDATIGMFASMDPFCEKYYHISPYVYCGGNPVNRVDPDGYDYRLIFDHEQMKITIYANYDVGDGAEEVFREAQQYWNNLSYKIGDYSVSFDINSNADENGNYLNSFNVIDADNYVAKEETGATKDGHHIVLYNGRYSVDTGIHEIGHSLGLVHYTEDDAYTNIMYWNAAERTNNLVTKQQVENILYYARQLNPDREWSNIYRTYVPVGKCVPRTNMTTKYKKNMKIINQSNSK